VHQLFCKLVKLGTFREKHRCRVCGKRVMRRIFGPKGEEVTRGWRKLYKGEVHKLYSSLDIVRMNGTRMDKSVRC
jgi:hypothetical protein